MSGLRMTGQLPREGETVRMQHFQLQFSEFVNLALQS